MFRVDNMEDLVGGHIYVAVLLIAGGAWHILVPPFKWVKKLFIFSGDGILSYSLFGVALAGFAASYYCGFDNLSYPEEFYGPTLQLKSAFLPRYFESQPTLTDGYTSRVWLANAHFYLAFFFLQGGLWHYQRARGFDIRSLLENWRQNWEFATDNPILMYQNPTQVKPQPWSFAQYEVPQAKFKPWLKQEQPFEDYIYRPSQGIEQTSLADINGVEKTLYQTTYHSQKDVFYQSSKQDKGETEELFGYSRDYANWLYELPRNMAKAAEYSKPIETVFYEPKHNYGSSEETRSAEVISKVESTAAIAKTDVRN
jgi:hypothetical protein